MKKIKIIHLLPLGLFAVFVALGLWGLFLLRDDRLNLQSIGFSLEGQSIVQVSMDTLDKTGEINLASWQGQAYAINVFASWCAPCQIESPAVARLATYLPVIGINFRDTEAQGFLDEYGNPYTVIGVDSTGEISLKLGVQAIPETFIISPEGVIILHHRGPIFANDMKTRFADAFKTLEVER